MYIVEIQRYEWGDTFTHVLDIVKTKEEALSRIESFVKKYNLNWEQSDDNSYDLEMDDFDCYIYYYEHTSFDDSCKKIEFWFI